jgi:hypothetical protein
MEDITDHIFETIDDVLSYVISNEEYIETNYDDNEKHIYIYTYDIILRNIHLMRTIDAINLNKLKQICDNYYETYNNSYHKNLIELWKNYFSVTDFSKDDEIPLLEIFIDEYLEIYDEDNITDINNIPVFEQNFGCNTNIEIICDNIYLMYKFITYVRANEKIQYVYKCVNTFFYNVRCNIASNNTDNKKKFNYLDTKYDFLFSQIINFALDYELDNRDELIIPVGHERVDIKLMLQLCDDKLISNILSRQKKDKIFRLLKNLCRRFTSDYIVNIILENELRGLISMPIIPTNLKITYLKKYLIGQTKLKSAYNV